MQRCWSLSEVTKDDNAVVTMGTFDGIHAGHQLVKHVYQLVERVTIVLPEKAHQRRVTAFGFDRFETMDSASSDVVVQRSLIVRAQPG